MEHDDGAQIDCFSLSFLSPPPQDWTRATSQSTHLAVSLAQRGAIRVLLLALLSERPIVAAESLTRRGFSDWDRHRKCGSLHHGPFPASSVSFPPSPVDMNLPPKNNHCLKAGATNTTANVPFYTNKDGANEAECVIMRRCMWAIVCGGNYTRVVHVWTFPASVLNRDRCPVSHV